ncbi:MAG TPA: VCBS repeat-containing protein [Planctomycetota bacterium]
MKPSRRFAPKHFLLALPLLAPPLAAQSTFAELQRRHLPAPVPNVGALATIDIEGDGDVDLLVGNASGPSAIWRNDGKGRFTDNGSPGGLAVNANTAAFAVGDVNGDGQQDLAWATYFGGLSLLLGGGGALWPAPAGYLPQTFAFVGAVCMFDADGDGDLDLVFGEAGGIATSNRLLLNNGAGVFTDAPSWLGISSPGALQFVPFDCDGDGDRDLLLVSWNGPPQLMRNTGTSFLASPLLASVITGVCATAGDVDGDGDADLVIGNMGSAPALRQDRLLLNNGQGVFTDVTATAMPSLDNWTSAVHLVDIDGDGDRDLLVTHSQPMLVGNRLGHSLLRNDGTGTFSDASATLPDNDLVGHVSVVFDVDGDGDSDYLFAGGHAQQLYWNDHGQLFDAAGPTLPARVCVTEAIAAGDLDADGLPELIVGGWNFSLIGGRTSVLWNDGTGHVDEIATNPVWPNGIYAGAALGDIDGDGDADLVFGLDQPGQNRVYRNDGNRVLTDVTSTALPSLLDFTRAVRLFDADGDGDRDLLFGNTDNSRLLLNNGLGTFTEVTSTALPPSSGTRDVAVGDVDGDGDLDVVRATDTGPNELWRNSGGVFQVASGSLPSIVQATEAVALADLDGDLDLDLIVGNRPDGPLDPRSWILWNDGAGAFLSPPVALGSSDVRAIAVGDIEGDGDVDFVLGGDGAAPRLFENQGGFFVSQASAMPADPRQTTRLLLVDIDGDGDLDLFEGDFVRNRVLLNLHRQLQSRHVFVPGSTVSLEAFVAAGAPGALPLAAVFLGLRGTPVATPFGVARLDLTTLVPVGFGAVIAPQTSVALSVFVPTNPGLVGVEIGAQLLALHDASSWRLSCLVAETVRQ